MISPTVEMAAKTMAENRVKFEAFCRSLSEDELERAVPNSDWRVKDFIIHLCELDGVIAQWMGRLKSGQPDAAGVNADGSNFDIDAYNNARVADRRDWPLEKILAEGAETRAAMIEVMESLADEHVDQIFKFAGDNKRPSAEIQFKLFLFGLARHDPIHVADMVKALPERASDPEMIAWLDDRTVEWYQKAMAGPPTR